MFTKNQAFVSFIFLYCLSFPIPLTYALFFTILFFLLVLCLLFFFSIQKWTFRLLICNLPFFPLSISIYYYKYTFKHCFALHFIDLKVLFPFPYLLWPMGYLGICHLISKYFWVHKFFLLVSTFILLWPENILCIISILLKLLRFDICPSIWPTLNNVPCTLEECIFCFCWVECSINVY